MMDNEVPQGTSEPKRILMVWVSDYPWDVRIEKVSNSLMDAGHEVHLVCRNLDRRPTFERVGRLNVHRLRPFPGSANSLLSIPFFLNPLWLLTLWRVIKRFRIHLVIVRDLPLSPAGSFVSSLFKIPCILDMAEVYPAMWRVPFEENRASLGDRLLKNPKMAEFIERVFLKRMNHIWVMVEESRQRLLKLGVDNHKASIVGNTPLVNSEYETVNTAAMSPGKAIKIIYTGVISPMRGLDTVICALSELKKESLNVQLIVAGQGENLGDLQDLTKKLGLENEVNFLGWVNHQELPELFAESHVGIVPHKVNGHTNTTLPNKLFDYMGYGLPVVVSNATPLERIVTECECGLVYQDQNVESLKQTIMQLLEPGRLEKFGENGRDAYKKVYNWKNDEATLLRDVSNCLG